MKQKGYDKYGGWEAIKGKKTGYFHTEYIDNRHWMISPEGNAFFAASICHFLAGDTKKACENIYSGDQKLWVADSLKKMRELGFNCAFAGITSPERDLHDYLDMDIAEDVFQTESFPYSVGIFPIKHPWEYDETEILPDVFDPSFTSSIEIKTKEICSKYSENPLVLGYYYGFGTFIKEQKWLNQLFSAQAGSYGRSALVEVLENLYGDDVDTFNRVYGTKIKSISDLKTSEIISYDKEIELRNYPEKRKSLNENKVRDFEALLKCLAVKFYSIMKTAVRKWDKNHMIFGSFVKEWSFSSETWKELAKHLDLLSPQHINKDISINEFATGTNKPIVVSDDEFGFYYENEPADYKGVKSIENRADLYSLCADRHYRDSDLVGITFCSTMFDQIGDNHNGGLTGFYDIEGKRREYYYDRVKEANTNLYERVSNPVSPEELKIIENKFFKKYAEYSVPEE